MGVFDTSFNVPFNLSSIIIGYANDWFRPISRMLFRGMNIQIDMLSMLMVQELLVVLLYWYEYQEFLILRLTQPATSSRSRRASPSMHEASLPIYQADLLDLSTY